MSRFGPVPHEVTDIKRWFRKLTLVYHPDKLPYAERILGKSDDFTVCVVCFLFIMRLLTPTHTQELTNIYEAALSIAEMRDMEAAAAALAADPIEILANAARAAATKKAFDDFEAARSQVVQQRQARDKMRAQRRAAKVLADAKKVPTGPDTPFYIPEFLVR